MAHDGHVVRAVALAQARLVVGKYQSSTPVGPSRFRSPVPPRVRGYAEPDAFCDVKAERGHKCPGPYNTVRPRASLGYRPPAPEVFVPAFAAWPAAPSRPAPPTRLPVAPRPTMN